METQKNPTRDFFQYCLLLSSAKTFSNHCVSGSGKNSVATNGVDFPNKQLNSVLTNSKGPAKFVSYNRVDLCSKWSVGIQIFVLYIRVFVITEYVISQSRLMLGSVLLGFHENMLGAASKWWTWDVYILNLFYIGSKGQSKKLTKLSLVIDEIFKHFFVYITSFKFRGNLT